jgi:uncharacterized membrane protein YdbT with pleckstrin-like domain
MKEGTKDLSKTDFELLWTGQPAGLWQRFLSLIHLNFTTYSITNDELLVQTGFFRRKTNTIELYTLKDPDLTESIYQRLLKIGTITVKVDSPNSGERFGTRVQLKNIKNPAEVRKLLRDAIEADVMERKITYFDRV